MSSGATLVFVIWGFIILGTAINNISESLYLMWIDWKNKKKNNR
jgi:hypothetical protein